MQNEYEIRPAQIADAHEIALVHIATWKKSYAGLIAQEFLDGLSLKNNLQMRMKILKKTPEIHFVATYQGKVVAFCDAGPYRHNKNLSNAQLTDRCETGEIYAIYVLQDHQHSGVGKALFEAATKRLKEKGLVPFIAWVLKNNHPAIAFYEKMGGKRVDETKIKIGDAEYVESAYRFEK